MREKLTKGMDYLRGKDRWNSNPKKPKILCYSEFTNIILLYLRHATHE
jgi:hypothetical protein